MLKKDVHGFIVLSVSCVSSAPVSASQLVLAVAGGTDPSKSWLGPLFSRTLDTLWSVDSQKN